VLEVVTFAVDSVVTACKTFPPPASAGAKVVLPVNFKNSPTCSISS